MNVSVCVSMHPFVWRIHAVLFLCVLNEFSSNISADDMLYTETDLEESMEKIETINFHEVKEVAGIKFWCYHAGHVLGAAMFMIEIAGVKVMLFLIFWIERDGSVNGPM